MSDLRNAPSYEVDVDQRSDEWFKQRRGIPTCSRFSEIVTPAGNPASSKYLWQLVAERIYGVSFSRDVSEVWAVQEGVVNEPLALDDLSAYLKREVRPGKFRLSTDGLYGGSPDGYIGDEPVEVKCPQIPNQLRNLYHDLAPDPKDYKVQLQGHCLLTGAERVHFVSWSPWASPIYIVVPRDEEFCTILSREVIKFAKKVAETTEKLLEKAKFDVEGYRKWLSENGRERRGRDG